MTNKLTALLAAALIAGGCSFAMAQGGGGAAGASGGAGGSGSGAAPSTPQTSQGGVAKRDTAQPARRMTKHKKKHKKHHAA